jgi:hypothetical protein
MLGKAHSPANSMQLAGTVAVVAVAAAGASVATLTGPDGGGAWRWLVESLAWVDGQRSDWLAQNHC